jgi:hypothetical protein
MGILSELPTSEYNSLLIRNFISTVQMSMVGKFLFMRKKGEREGLSPAGTWTKETLSTGLTAFPGRNHG